LKSSVLMGFRLSIYATALIISGYKYTNKLASIRIVRASIIIDFPERFIIPFYSLIYGAD
jgi:hypothetical protein